MGFWGSENHLCAYHNIPVMFYHVVNRIEFTKLASIGDFQVSLITVQKHKKYFLQELFAYNTNSAKSS